MRVFLNVVVELEGEEDEVVAQAKEILKGSGLPPESRITLVRDSDRSNKNLLLPRVEGRLGNHLTNKKISISDLE